MKKKLLALLTASLLLVSLVACGGSNSETGDSTTNDIGLIEPGVIYAATSPDYPPFEYLEGNEIVGFDIDLLNAVASRAGLRVEYTPMEFESIISAVQAGQYDVGMSAFTADPERKALFGDTYYQSAQMAIVSVDSPYTTLEDLNGKKLGAGMGTTGEPAANELSDDVTLVTTSVGFPMLLSGQLDAYVCDLGVATNAVETGKYRMIEEPISEEKVSMLFKEGNDALCDELNKYLAEFMETDEYTQLLEKYGLN